MPKGSWNKGKSWPESVKRRISESRKGKSAWNKGKPWTDEVRDKISKSKKGQVPWNKGVSWPRSIKKKISRSKLATTLDLRPFYERDRYSKRLRFEVFKRDSFRCQYCGKSNKETILELDRKIPGMKGGKYTLENCITACIDCNRGKADLDLL